MALRPLGKTRWVPYFKRVSRALADSPDRMMLHGLDRDSAEEVESRPLWAIRFDEELGLVVMFLSGERLEIGQPLDIQVEEEDGHLATIAILDACGYRHVLTLRRPLPLPEMAGSQPQS